METLNQIGQRLREAVRRGRYDEIRLAALDYRRRFDDEWRSMPEEERGRSKLPLNARELIERALESVRISRETLAARRRALKTTGRYLQNGHERRIRTWGTAG